MLCSSTRRRASPSHPPRGAIMAAVASGDPMEEEPVEEEEAAAGGAAAAAAAAGPSKPMAGVQINRSAGQIKDSGAPQRATPFWICPECGNMLYPKEDKERKVLRRACKNCDFNDEANSNLIYVHDLKPDFTSSDPGADKVKDPTLPRATNTNCNMCGHNESVFFQAPLKGDEGMKLIFMCTNCAYKWKA